MFLYFCADDSHCEYIDLILTGGVPRRERFFINSHPEFLTKKVSLLKHFRQYMQDHLLRVSSPPLIISCIMTRMHCIFISICDL